jgi:hypothetical protein
MFINFMNLHKNLDVFMKLSLFLIKHHIMNMYGGVDVYFHIFLIPALNEGEWSASCFGCFTAGETVADTCWIEAWVGPSAGLNAMEKR